MRSGVRFSLGLLCGCGLSQVYFPEQDASTAASLIRPGTVTTVAGNGTFGYHDGSGGRNGSAEFGWPMGLGLDRAGNVFVADAWAQRIRALDSNGTVTTLTGNGAAGLQDGSGGPNGSSEFSFPVALAVASSGEIFVADTDNSVLRRVDAHGNVITLPFEGSDGLNFSLITAIALDASDNLYLADTQNQRIVTIDTQGHVATLAGNPSPGYADGYRAAAQFNEPSGLAVDSEGNVYVGDSQNQRIRKIDRLGNVTTVAGTGVLGFADGPPDSAEFNLPSGLALEASGDLVVADCGNNRIRRVDPRGTVTTVAGNGAPGSDDGSAGPTGIATFDLPFGVAVDPAGNIYVGGNDDHRVRKISF